MRYHGDSKKASFKSKSTPNVNMTILKSTPTPETPKTPHPHESDQILLEIFRKIVKDELSTYEAAIEEIINSNVKSTNERSDKLSAKMAELTKILDHTQDQLDDELKIVKTDIKNLDTAVKEIEQKIEEYPDVNKKVIEHEEITSA